MNRTICVVVLMLASSIAATALVAQDSPRRMSLDEALALFSSNSLDLRVARLDVAESRGIARQAGAFPNPTLSVTHEPLSANGTGYTESYANLSQSIELPGRRGARTETADWNQRAAEARFAADSIRLAFEVKRAYVDALVAEESLAIAEQAAEVFRTAAGTATAREANGDISRYDLLRVQVELRRYETLQAEAELRVAATRRALALLVLPDAQSLEVAPVGLVSEFPVAPSEGLPSLSSVAGRRYEVAAAAASARAATADVRFIQSDRFDGFTATGGFKRQSDGFRGAFLGVAVPLPLFDRKGGAVAGAEARAETLGTRTDLIRRQVESDFRRASEKYDSVRRRVELRGVGGASSDLLQIARVAYDLGEMELLELLDAAEAQWAARTADARLRADLWIAFYDLERATGGFSAPPDAAALEPDMER